MDIKGAFLNLNRAQLLDICYKIGFPFTCINWIHSFLHSRTMKLAFNNKTMTNSITIYTNVPQGSPVSPILFLIYANQLFKCNAYLPTRLGSYIDDIEIQASSRSTHENYKILQNSAKKLIEWGQNNHIKFNMKKTKLIHFDHANRSLNESIKIKEFTIKPKEVVK